MCACGSAVTAGCGDAIASTRGGVGSAGGAAKQDGGGGGEKGSEDESGSAFDAAAGARARLVQAMQTIICQVFGWGGGGGACVCVCVSVCVVGMGMYTCVHVHKIMHNITTIIIILMLLYLDSWSQVGELFLAGSSSTSGAGIC